MSKAFLCEVCEAIPHWRIQRTGDVATTWACDEHLAGACDDLQRDGEITNLTIWDAHKKDAKAQAILTG
jgi:hypothetical protein